MSPLRAYLFKSLQLERTNQSPISIGSPLARSLLAYLLLHRNHPVDRRQLAFIFWADSTETAARRNLRQYLHRIKQIFDDESLGEDLLISTASTIQINPAINIWLDVDIFREQTRPEAGVPQMELGLQLYRGDLLADLYDEWCESPRRELRQRYLQSLDTLSRKLQEEYRPEDALLIARKWIEAEIYDEAAHRRLMSIYLDLGKGNQAIRHYRELKEKLAAELNTIPMPETRAMVEMIKAGKRETEKSIPAKKMESLPKPKSPQYPLVGRERELAELQGAWQQAQKTRGRFILLAGDSGIGKTRLLHEYLLSINSQSGLHSLCHQVESMVAYAPLRGILLHVLEKLPEERLQELRPWLSALMPILPELRQQLPNLPIWRTGHREKVHTPEAVMQILLGSDTPLLLVLDDLHWADSLTWELLEYLTYRIEELPLVILGACRVEDLTPEHERFLRILKRKESFSYLPLQRLTIAETKKLAKYLLAGEKVGEYFYQRLHEETEGNPFFIIEGIRSLQESQQPARLPFGGGQERGNANLPPQIQSLIEARLDRLNAQSQELLSLAAAIGRAFTFSLLAEVSEMHSKEVIGFIEEWLQKGLVTENREGYDFSHDKIRQVAYANLSRARKQYVHRCIAEIFENAIIPVDAATIAHHYSRSDQAINALPYLTTAGEQALRAHSYHEARQFGSQAVSLLGRQAGPKQKQERIDLNLQLAQAYAFSGDLPHAQEMVEQAEQFAAQLNDDERLGKVFRRSAQIYWQRGNAQAANDYAHRTLRVAEETQNKSLLRASLRMLGRSSIALAAFDDAIAYLLRYARLDESRQSYHPNLVVIYGYLGVAYARVGSWQRAEEAAQHGLTLAKENGPPSTIAFALAPLAYIRVAHHDWEGCAQTLDEVPEFLAEGEEFSPLYAIIEALRGYIQTQKGKAAQGTKKIQKSLDWMQENDYRVFHYIPRIFLAESLLKAKKISQAKEEAEKALKNARESGNRWAVGVTLRLLGEILTAGKKPDWLEIEAHFSESLRILRRIRARPDLARTYLALRRLYDRAGQSAWAVDCHFRATSIYEELRMTKELELARGRAAGERKGAAVLLDMGLKGPDAVE